MAGANPYPSLLVTPEVSSPGPRHPGSFQSGASVLRFKVFSGLLTPSSFYRLPSSVLRPRHPGSFQSGASVLRPKVFSGLLTPSSVARTTRRNTTPRLPSAGPEAPVFLPPSSVFRPPWRVQPGEKPLQDCPAPGRRPPSSYLRPPSSVLRPRHPGSFQSGASVLRATVYLPLLVAVSIAASECRFSSPFGKTKSLCATIPPTKLQMSKESGS